MARHLRNGFSGSYRAEILYQDLAALRAVWNGGIQMMKTRFAAGASLAALGLMLAACGGGGVNSTPTPTPTGGGNGGGGTPTPTPGNGGGTPTPTTGANDDLIAPLASESFTNFSHTAAGTYPTSGGVISAQSQSKAAGTIRFDASKGAYTVSVAGRSQTFGNADMVKSNNYHRQDGSVVDDLTLTPAGTSGSSPLTYRYVGAAFWQRQTVGSSSIQGTMDAFVYGVPSKSIPVGGRASYAVDVMGVLNTSSWEPVPMAFNGKGALTADFSSGKVSGDAEFVLYRANGSRISNSSFDGTLSFDAALAASSPSFAGRLEARSFGIYSGTIDGGFFGPDGQDVGATYSATSENGDVMVGALLGTKDASLDVVPLADLQGVTHFRGAIGGGAAYMEVLAYDAAQKTYTIPDFAAEPTGQLKLGPSQLAASQPDSRFIEYDVKQNGQNAKVLFYRTGGANPEVALTYASFALVEIKPQVAGGGEEPYYRQVLFGSRTPSDLLPRSGSATYNGVLYGDGIAYQGEGLEEHVVNLYSVTGTSRFVADFASYKVTVELHPFLKDMSSGVVTDYGVHNGSAIVDLDRASFSGSFNGDGSTALVGFFFGPRAEEIGASFGLRDYDRSVSYRRYVKGVAIGAKN